MKIKDGFMLRNVAGQNIVVSVNPSQTDFNAMITLNDTGAFLWSAFSDDTTVEKVAASLCGEYEIDTEKALNDVKCFAEKLRANNLLAE